MKREFIGQMMNLGMVLCIGCASSLLKDVKPEKVNTIEKVLASNNVLYEDAVRGERDYVTAEMWPATEYGRPGAILVLGFEDPVEKGKNICIYIDSNPSCEGYYTALQCGENCRLSVWASGNVCFPVLFDEVTQVVLMTEEVVYDRSGKVCVDAVVEKP